MGQVTVGDWLHVTPPEPAQLVYMDPPYMTGRDWEDRDGEVQFTDRWESLDSYLGYMQPRLEKVWEGLREDGSFFLHVDPTASHYLKVMCDRIFGYSNFVNEIVWDKGAHQHKWRYPQKHDTIMFYRKDYEQGKHKFRYQYKPLKESSRKGYRFEDENGVYTTGRSAATGKEYKYYLKDCKGARVTACWSDLGGFHSQARERVGYPTQKPLKLLYRIIEATTDEGDLVVDPMCGSGTTLVAAEQMCRRYWGCDINPGAVRLAETRLADTMGQPSLI